MQLQMRYAGAYARLLEQSASEISISEGIICYNQFVATLLA
jgi:hypothetical protein